MFGKSVPKLEMIEPKPMTDKQVKDRLRLASAQVRRAPAAGAQSTGDDGFVASMATGFPTQGTAAGVAGASLGQAMQFLKNLSDCNNTTFHVSRAFAEAVNVGVGWLEHGIQDGDEKPIYSRHESWRNMLTDSTSSETTYSSSSDSSSSSSDSGSSSSSDGSSY